MLPVDYEATIVICTMILTGKGAPVCLWESLGRQFDFLRNSLWPDTSS